MIDYKPFNCRAEHDMLNKVCADLIRLERLVYSDYEKALIQDIRFILDTYINNQMRKTRQDDE